MVTGTLNQVLSDLYTDKITIRDACRILGKTREDIWNLLDSFEYFPISEDVITACEIEKNSMRLIENEALKDFVVGAFDSYQVDI